MTAMKLAPSILTADFGRLADEARAVEAAGADYLHLDVMDGRFVPPITFGTLVVEALRKVTKLPLDIHLMIEEPERHVESFAGAGGDIINVHVEASAHLHRIVHQIKGLDRRAGVCLNPATPLDAIEDVLDDADQIMVMGVNPGWGGQAFIPNTLAKVERLRALLDARGARADIEIDGGVKAGNIASCARAGANVLVTGSSVFNDAGSVEENLRGLRTALEA